MPTKQGESASVPRAARTLLDVLPRSVDAEVHDAGTSAVLVVAGQRLRVSWAGGGLRSVRQLLDDGREEFDVITARRFSPAARELLADARMGWADESGAAEIAVGGIVVSREGRPQEPARLTQWTPSVAAVAEALLCGVQPTVAATEEATGLSTGSCTNALRFLSDEGLLTAGAKRGRGSARRLDDPDQLLDAYAAAVDAAKPAPSLQVGLQGRDLLEALGEVGQPGTRSVSGGPPPASQPLRSSLPCSPRSPASRCTSRPTRQPASMRVRRTEEFVRSPVVV